MSNFNMRTKAWFIMIPTEADERKAVMDFIIKQVGRCPTPSISAGHYFTNYRGGNVDEASTGVMIGDEIYHKVADTQIKLTFKRTTCVDNVKYPVQPETDTQRQIRELDLVIREASAKLDSLKNTQGVK